MKKVEALISPELTVTEVTESGTDEVRVSTDRGGTYTIDAGSQAPLPTPRAARFPAMSDWTKVLISNVFLATAVLTLVFHAPLGSAALGGAGGGLAMWALWRLNALRRRA